MELCHRIAEETRNKIRLEKKLIAEKKEREKKLRRSRTVSKLVLQKEQQAEAKKRLDTEVHHQTEEAETRALGKKMLSDGVGNKPSFSNSCQNLLNNFQGKDWLFIMYFSRFNILFFPSSRLFQKLET